MTLKHSVKIQGKLSSIQLPIIGLILLVMHSIALAESSSTPLRFLCLGDSYTIGESVEESARWPMQLAAGLEPSLERKIEVQIIAQTGWTTDELDQAIDRAQSASQIDAPYPLVSLLIGVNNQYRNRSVEQYGDEFTALLHRAIAFAGNDASRVLVLSIPDWGNTPFGAKDARGPAAIAQSIDAFNAENARLTKLLGAHYVDVTGLSRANDAELVADDGLHPSAKAYAQWAKRALPSARSALQARTSSQ